MTKENYRPKLMTFVLQIMEPPWKAYNVLRKMDYPYEVSTNKLYLLDPIACHVCHLIMRVLFHISAHCSQHERSKHRKFLVDHLASDCWWV